MALKNRKITSAGFTLIELLVAMAILGVVLAGVTGLFVQTGRLNTTQEMTVEMTQEIRGAKHLLVDELRSAGCNPKDNIRIGFELDRNNDRFDTDDNSIHFTRDIDNKDSDELFEPDGAIDGPNENVRYWREDSANNLLASGNNTVGTLVRSTGGGGQPVADNIIDLKFRYFDKDDAEILPANMTKKSVLSKIRTVEVFLAGQVENPSRVNPGNRTWEQTFRIRVRNL